MLEEEILKQKENVTKNTLIYKQYSYQPTIKIPEEIFIPENYIDDLDIRMSIYKRISLIESEKKRNELMIELIDRFGQLPQEVKNLFKLIKIKILCWKNNIELIEFSKKGILFSFYNNEPSNPEKIIKLGFSQNNKIFIRPDQKIFYNFFGELNEDRFNLVKRIINIFN